jgi:hypothetical protein
MGNGLGDGAVYGRLTSIADTRLTIDACGLFVELMTCGRDSQSSNPAIVNRALHQ